MNMTDTQEIIYTYLTYQKWRHNKIHIYWIQREAEITLDSNLVDIISCWWSKKTPPNPKPNAYFLEITQKCKLPPEKMYNITALIACLLSWLLLCIQPNLIEIVFILHSLSFEGICRQQCDTVLFRAGFSIALKISGPNKPFVITKSTYITLISHCVEQRSKVAEVDKAGVESLLTVLKIFHNTSFCYIVHKCFKAIII